ncbi:hypothetical protein D3C78_1247820 [compost metagenome]
MRLDGMSNVAQSRTGFYRFDAEPHGFPRFFDQSTSQGRDVADKIHFAGIRYQSLFLECDIDIYDSARFKVFVRFRNAVTHDFIHRGIQHVRIIVLTFAGRAGLQFINNICLCTIIDFQSGHARHNKRVQHLEHGSKQRACMALSGEFIRGFNGN